MRLALQMVLATLLLLLQLVGPGSAASIAEALLSDKLTADTLLQVGGEGLSLMSGLAPLHSNSAVQGA